MADNAGSASRRRPPGPLGQDAGANNPPAASSRRSFAVEAHAGRKIAGWPVGRLDLGADDLRVRLSFPWFVTRSATKDTITLVTLDRTTAGAWCIRFEDSGQRLADVHVHLPVRAQRIIDELRRHGYPVADRKTGQPVVQLPKRRPAA